jgi:hypothetical protein
MYGEHTFGEATYGSGAGKEYEGEIIEEAVEQTERREGSKVRTFFIRHSRATYATYAEKLASEDPESSIDIETQLPDLPEAGVELAENSAHEFFQQFDPEEDVFYMVSSSQMRALETANVYVRVAQEMGFEVLEQENTGTNIAAEIGVGYVKSINKLSLHGKENARNQLEMSIFNSPKTLPKINWDATSSETKERWEKARSIVLADDKGNWGANFATYAQTVADTVPGFEHIETPQALYDTQYQGLKRLAAFARKQVPENGRLNVVAFGHENYMGVALEDDTGEEAIANTEAVELTEEGVLKRFMKPE